MRYFKVHVATNKIGSGKSDVLKFEDDVTQEEIDEMCEEWVWDNIEADWHEVDKESQ